MRAETVPSNNVNNFLLPSKKYLFSLVLFGFALVLTGCSALNDSSDDKDDTLYVKFINSPSSQYSITCIELQAMGRSGEGGSPSGTWSADILEDGQTLAPGASDFFTLDIPNLHYSVYRLGVDNGNGTEIMLHTQSNYQGLEPTITHWGSDERTVEVTVRYDDSSGQIVVNGWSDWAGIE